MLPCASTTNLLMVKILYMSTQKQALLWSVVPASRKAYLGLQSKIDGKDNTLFSLIIQFATEYDRGCKRKRGDIVIKSELPFVPHLLFILLESKHYVQCFKVTVLEISARRVHWKGSVLLCVFTRK